MVLKGLNDLPDNDLPDILWSTRTTVREATAQTPFNLVYGSEVVFPVEVGTSPRITFYDYNNNEEEKRVNLNLLPEARGNALLKVISYKLKLTKLFSRRVKHRPFLVHDWVLRKFEATGREPRLGKL